MRWPWVLVALAPACSSSADVHLFFRDELVEAPARFVDMIAVAGASCETLLAARHGDLAKEQTAVWRATTTYPVDPRSDVLSDFPQDGVLALDVAAYDRAFLQVSRGCTRVEAGADGPIELELRSLPRCIAAPARLDIMIALDSSPRMHEADPRSAHRQALSAVLLADVELGALAQWGLVAFGGKAQTQEIVSATPDATRVDEGLRGVEIDDEGLPRLYDGIALAARLLRARAVCGRRPAIVLLAAGADEKSEHRFEEAKIALTAAVDDPDDDIFAYGLAMTRDAHADLDAVIVESQGIAALVPSPDEVTISMQHAARALRRLLP